jgi:hypothetical protein
MSRPTRPTASPKPTAAVVPIKPGIPTAPAAKVLAAGKFYRDPTSGAVYFAERRTPPPRPITIGSPAFRACVSRLTGVDMRSRNFGPTLAGVMEEAGKVAKRVRVETCSAYERNARRFLVNVGAGNVAECAPRGVRIVSNGACGVLF